MYNHLKSGIFLLLGSNQGNSMLHLSTATRKLALELGPIVKLSSVYRTKAWGNEHQPDFLNQVLCVDTNDDPVVILEKIMRIELSMGRTRTEKWGPRIIDIDILFVNDQVIDKSELKVPHPGIPQRRFVLVPMAEIAPSFIHPVLNKTIAELLDACADNLPVAKVDPSKAN